ncbi:phage major capsid protein [Malaciobacter canalis]|uniref:Phage major capsid protein n=1 Tax=Malaciobacter canalis TaxID=1912871 RepID=A0ABX4LRE2_9BACT|nr:phage major capsid protein [Malaciobacter canalis]PHO10323.1 phage major capsid protein [Malaciobacter canalis]QEE32428.1 phage major capsid protein [Malaciobacter canalis]
MPKKLDVRNLENLDTQYREYEVRGVNEENRTIDLSFSSEEPYERWYGIEILDHSTKSVDMSRLNNAAPLLFNHQRNIVAGVIESAKIDNKRGFATVRFSRNSQADEIFKDVVDGILTKVSVGYQVLEMKLESESEGVDTFRVTKWLPFEISIVSIPADDTVGVGRSEELQKNKIKILNQKEEVKEMPGEKKTEEKQVDVKVVAGEATKAERSRISDITAIGAAHGLGDEAQRAIEEGISLEQFRSIALAKISEKAAPTVNTTNAVPEIGMSDDEVREYSFAKVLRALANPTDSTAQKAAGFEFEVSMVAQKKSGVEAQGVLVPFDVFKRDMTVTSTGGITVDTQMGGLIEMLKNKSAVMKLAEVLPGLNGNISFPKQTSSMKVDKLTETDETNDSDIGLGELTMSPSRFGGSGAYSKQLIHQSSIAIENLIKNDLFGQIGLKIDLEAINKVLAETGIGLVSIGTDGGPIKNGHIVDLETEVAVDNADIGRLAYVMNARTRGYLKQTPVADGNPKMILSGNDLNGYNYGVSNQLPANLAKGTGTDLSAMIFGNWADLLIGMWGGIDLIVDPYTLAKNGKIRVIADQFADVGVRNASSFAAIKDGKVF